MTSLLKNLKSVPKLIKDWFMSGVTIVEDGVPVADKGVVIKGEFLAACSEVWEDYTSGKIVIDTIADVHMWFYANGKVEVEDVNNDRSYIRGQVRR